MTDLFPREILFPVIRAGMNLESPDLHLANQDFSLLKEIGDKQSLIPIIRRGLKKCGYEKEADIYLEREHMKAMYQFVLHDQALKDLGSVFEKNEIDYIPLKGSVLRNLYPEPWMRTSCDIDILVHEEELEKAIQVIEEGTAIKFVKRSYHDVSMTDGRIHLELHFNIKENMQNIDPLLEKVWSYSHSDEAGHRYVLTSEYQIFHTVAHMSYHLHSGGLGIRPFLDLWLLRKKTEYSEDKVREMCSSCEILTFYEKSCELADTWFKGKDYTEDSALFEAYCLEGGVFDFGTNTGAAKAGDKSPVHYLGKRLFADRDMLEGEYPDLKTKPYLLPYYQVKRWTRLLDPKKRKHALSEIRKVRDTDEQQIEKMNDFLKKLGI